MASINLKFDGDTCWPDLESKADEQITHVQTFDVALRPGCMASGKAAVAIRIDLPDGRTVLAHTSQELFDSAARAFRARLEYLDEQQRKGGKPS